MTPTPLRSPGVTRDGGRGVTPRLPNELCVDSLRVIVPRGYTPARNGRRTASSSSQPGSGRSSALLPVPSRLPDTIARLSLLVVATFFRSQPGGRRLMDTPRLDAMGSDRELGRFSRF